MANGKTMCKCEKQDRFTVETNKKYRDEVLNTEIINKREVKSKVGQPIIQNSPQ